MISPNSLNKEISNDSGKFSGPSSVIISETDEEVFDQERHRLKGGQKNGETSNKILNLDANVPSSMTSNAENLQKQLRWMQKNLELLKQENLVLEKAVSGQATSLYGTPSIYQMSRFPLNTRPTSPSYLLSSYKSEMDGLKAELSRINSQLEMCEMGRKSFSDRWLNRLQSTMSDITASLKIISAKNFENPIEKTLVESLQNRLKAAEERIRRNRKDMLGTLSGVEESLLAENAQYKMSESEARRSLKQKTEQLQSIKLKHKALMEMFQRLRLRSSDNGIIDIKDVLKNYAVDEGSEKAGESSNISEEINLLEEIKKENKKQVNMLIKEKSVLSSEMADVSDESFLNKMENEKLKKSLNELNSIWKRELEEFKQNQNVVLQRVLEQIESFNKEAGNLCKCEHQSLGAVKVLEDTLETQERLLASTISELDQLNSLPPQLPTNISKATTSTQTQDSEPEKKTSTQNSNLKSILDFIKLRSSDDVTSKPEVKEQELPSPNVDVQSLHDKISKLEVDLEYAEKNLAFQKEQCAKLQNQASIYQEELRRKAQTMELLENNEKDLRRDVVSYKLILKELQEDLAEKDKELKLLQSDKGSIQRLLERDRIDVAGNEDKAADIDYIKQALELDIMTSRNNLEASLKENNHLKLSLDQTIRELDNERDLTSAATYDKMMLQQQLYNTEQERDKEMKEKERLTMENSLLQLENQKLSSTLKAKENLNMISTTASEKQLKNNIKKLTFELEQTKQQLEGKEKELVFLQDTLKFVLNSNSSNSADQASTSAP